MGKRGAVLLAEENQPVTPRPHRAGFSQRRYQQKGKSNRAGPLPQPRFQRWTDCGPPGSLGSSRHRT